VNRATILIALTSIHWREAWKYGERAFRYCQHDLGHAVAAVRIAAELQGLSAQMLPGWSQSQIAALTGIDRDADYVDAEREAPGCVLSIARDVTPVAADAVLAAVRAGEWTGAANQLSEDHVQWTFIDEIARDTEDPGRSLPASPAGGRRSLGAGGDPAAPAYPAEVILQRRSAVALDGQSSIGRDAFFDMLAHTLPSNSRAANALWWDARIHLALFVHRVDAVDPGIYVLVRHDAALDRLRNACGREFLWERAHAALPLFLLHRGDCRRLAQRLSCDQEIAADGFFSLGMIADFDASLAEFGPSFYRHLFWESGVVGQLLYLAAESAGARGTGIGCFYDDPVHEVLGLSGHAFQSLYHFTIGMPVEDSRLMTKPGYSWET
jgi:nitroreductase